VQTIQKFIQKNKVFFTFFVESLNFLCYLTKGIDFERSVLNSPQLRLNVPHVKPHLLRESSSPHVIENVYID
jgi:hypothetical protein